ncbi:MAG: hypothetical protein JWR88_528 [Pseudonocardia sp.]|jgi:hypothetical protein|nr:hypothetical protein [Pseudonocardia sp.]
MDAQPRLGVDIGRVIIAGSDDPDGADTAFFGTDESAMLATPAVDGVFDVLPRLVERFAGRVWLVSKCGERIQRRTERWLDHHRFFERTGIPPDHLRFTLRRADKAVHARELGLTHFVDDRLDVLEALRDVVPRLYLFGPQPQPAPDWVEHTPDWPAVGAAIALDRDPNEGNSRHSRTASRAVNSDTDR